ncbi:hypothetical protein PENTCL1PPCAC_9227, partial [Pristionchus entomophagus]
NLHVEHVEFIHKRLRWNPPDFGNLTEIRIDPKKISKVVEGTITRYHTMVMSEEKSKFARKLRVI